MSPQSRKKCPRVQAQAYWLYQPASFIEERHYLPHPDFAGDWGLRLLGVALLCDPVIGTGCHHSHQADDGQPCLLITNCLSSLRSSDGITGSVFQSAQLIILICGQSHQEYIHMKSN